MNSEREARRFTSVKRKSQAEGLATARTSELSRQRAFGYVKIEND